MITCCSGLATLQGSAPATQGCLTQELEGKEEEGVVEVAAGNMEQASVSSVTGGNMCGTSMVQGSASASVVQVWYKQVS